MRTRRALSWAISDCLRRVVLGDHQQPARVAVEAMDDARPRDAGDPAVLRSAGAGEQRVDERVAVVMAGRRVDDEAGRLVDDQQVVVLVDDPQRDVRCGREVERDRFGDVEPDLGPGGDDRVGPDRHAVDGQPAVGDELLDVAARQTRRVGDEPVDPPGRPVRDAHGADARPRPAPQASGDSAASRARGRSRAPVRTVRNALSDEQQDRAG